MVGGFGSTIEAKQLYVSGGVDDAQNYIAPAVKELHAGTNDPVDDPFLTEGSRLPVPTTANGVVNTEFGNVSISTGTPQGLVAPNIYDPTRGETTLNPGIYNGITITGGVVTFKPGIYVLQNTRGGGNIMSITGGMVTANNVMFYNTGSTWNARDGGADQADLGDFPPTPTSDRTRFGGISLNGPNVNMTPINNPVFQDMVFYQRRLNAQNITINNGASFPDGVRGRIYAKWGKLSVSGNGTYNFSIVVGSLESSGNALITVKDSFAIAPRIYPVRLVE
jgi:hypothetical protein